MVSSGLGCVPELGSLARARARLSILQKFLSKIDQLGATGSSASCQAQ